jgi:uracil-DNA glycosylase family 4
MNETLPMEWALTPELRALEREVTKCRRCPRLVAWREQVAREKRRAFADEEYWGRPVPGWGDPAARLLVLGLAPAAHGGNRTGRVFTGDGAGGSGDFLMAALHAHGLANQPFSRGIDDGLELKDAWIAAVARCAPPDNRPTPQEIANCRPHLRAEISALPNLRVYVALGRIAFDACWQLLAERGVRPARRPRFEHGALFRNDGAPAIVASYHPSRQNTHTGRLTQPMLRAVFRKAKALVVQR